MLNFHLDLVVLGQGGSSNLDFYQVIQDASVFTFWSTYKERNAVIELDESLGHTANMEGGCSGFSFGPDKDNIRLKF